MTDVFDDSMKARELDMVARCLVTPSERGQPGRVYERVQELLREVGQAYAERDQMTRALAGPPVVLPSSPQMEYRFVQCRNSSVVALNDLARDGWRVSMLIQAGIHGLDSELQVTFLLERPKRAESDG